MLFACTCFEPLIFERRLTLDLNHKVVFARTSKPLQPLTVSIYYSESGWDGEYHFFHLGGWDVFEVGALPPNPRQGTVASPDTPSKWAGLWVAGFRFASWGSHGVLRLGVLRLGGVEIGGVGFWGWLGFCLGADEALDAGDRAVEFVVAAIGVVEVGLLFVFHH